MGGSGTDDADRLRAIVLSNAWMMRTLDVVRLSGLNDAWVGAGALRDLVWGTLFGHGFEPTAVRDVDVAFFDRGDLSRDVDQRATALLARMQPDAPWEASNQAAVHMWFHTHLGGEPVPPFGSVAEAIATWPETATAVAVRLGTDSEIEVCAPHGLDDLLGGVWRRNPARVSVARSRERLARHRPAERWPGVRVIPPA
ncbi:MAG TPA: nucleotidyltransferase family protein [Micromonosporaceae bacterium]|nr:nucleotidyltransferase family protein [Micromonosporaceae bacterium]